MSTKKTTKRRPSKSCDCLDKLKIAIEKQGKTDVELGTVVYWKLDGSGLDRVACPPLKYWYRESGRAKRLNGLISFTYCPFCGVRATAEAKASRKRAAA